MFFYNIVIFFYRTGIYITSCFNSKAKIWISGRKDLLPKIQSALKNETQKIIWVHTASLGEFEQGKPLIEAIKKKHPTYKIFLSFFSPSGYTVRKFYKHADYIYYMPIDTKKNAKLFIAYVKPEIAIFIKYEFWYHFLSQLKQNNVPAYLVSANFRKNQLFFKKWGYFYRKIITCFSHIFVQNEGSKKLLQQIGYYKVTITGDTRFDSVYNIAKNTKEFPNVEKFKQNKKLLICGSTWWADEKNIIKWINESTDSIKYIIAPHEINKKHIQKLTKNLRKDYVLFSELNGKDTSDIPILIIDRIGILASLYRYGDVAYIGGGFGKGIHNILEPAAFALPVIFGPRYHKFQEAKDILNEKGGFTYNSYKEFSNILKKVFSSDIYLKKLGTSTKNYVQKNLGSTKKIIKFFDNFLIFIILVIREYLFNNF